VTGSTTVEAGRIEVDRLTKRFGDLTAVDDLSFSVAPGRITGFLGPNGAGKTTTLRMVLGLVQPTSGRATIGGRHYHDIPIPLATVGSALEATNFHPGRTGRDHLRVLADTAYIAHSRVDEMLELVGLGAAGRKRAGAYSMGMRQRLGLAAALLGDPQVLILDEPANGLDPEGIRWLRGLLRHVSSQGKTVLVSSHMLQEVEQTVDDIIIINRGRLVQQGPMSDLHASGSCVVRTTDPRSLLNALQTAGIDASEEPDGALRAVTADLTRVGDVALAAGLPIHELRLVSTDLESLFFSLTEGQPSTGEER
jgi:ABC-2 type transport system ATP-binding protein